MDLFDIDIHTFTVIKSLFNLVVKFKYIYSSQNYKTLYHLSEKQVNINIDTL